MDRVTWAEGLVRENGKVDFVLLGCKVYREEELA